MERREQRRKNRPKDYLERHIFPTLLPGMEEMLRIAKKTERRKRFDPLDFLTQYLYQKNPRFADRGDIVLWDIPFVREILKRKPRPPLPLSATWTEDEAATVIQAHYRGYLVRMQPDIQEFRQWSKGVRQEQEAALIIQRNWKRFLRSKSPPKESNM
ncbi:IQ domain-containing protein K-like [Oscarella lobularis]|uniref:IQ domain-containing protein K-like n=1 Tax=Oscarella lobularis TaxID=121494 RepID=UPI0033133027